MTQDLDALPLPVPTHFRNGVLYAFSADQIRAARLEGYELAKREAQNGREPVAWRWRNSVGDVVTEWHDYNASAREYIEQQVREENGVIEYAYTSPPPKSEHDLYKTGDAGVPREICDRNGEVVLGLCKRCGKAEIQLSEPCAPPKSDEARDALIRAARWFADNPDSPKSALIHITEALAALDAQQKGGDA